MDLNNWIQPEVMNPILPRKTRDLRSFQDYVLLIIVSYNSLRTPF